MIFIDFLSFNVISGTIELQNAISLNKRFLSINKGEQKKNPITNHIHAKNNCKTKKKCEYVWPSGFNFVISNMAAKMKIGTHTYTYL